MSGDGGGAPDVPPDRDDGGETRELLARWHAGDRRALDGLLHADLEWIREHVHQRLSPRLRRGAETQDYVQDAVLEVLQYSPRFQVQGRGQFRRLVAQIVENMLRDRGDFFRSKRRDLDRQAPLPPDSVLQLDPSARTATRPSEAAARHEEEAWLRLALELLSPEDRDVIVLRQWDGLEFADIGSRLGMAADAARMRFARALPKLMAKVEALRRGEI